MELQYRVPATVEDMLPPKTSSLNTEAANVIRGHWDDDLKVLYQALSGEIASIHGSCDLDEFALVMKVKEIGKENGYALINSVSTKQLMKALRIGYRRNAGHSVKLLKDQYRQVHLTDQAKI
jgi:hypothetical protein